MDTAKILAVVREPLDSQTESIVKGSSKHLQTRGCAQFAGQLLQPLDDHGRCKIHSECLLSRLMNRDIACPQSSSADWNTEVPVARRLQLIGLRCIRGRRDPEEGKLYGRAYFRPITLTDAVNDY